MGSPPLSRKCLEFDEIGLYPRSMAFAGFHRRLGRRVFFAAPLALAAGTALGQGADVKFKRSSLAMGKYKAEAERLDARQALTSLDAYQLLFARYQELEHARHEVETMRGRMIPLAEKALASAEQGYEEARFSFLQVTQARALTLDLERDAIDAAARYHHLLADIERATAVSGETTP
mgnify:CR=1 FL=1